MDRNRADDEPRRSASSGYALGRLRRAMETALSHSDPEVRRRAEQKALAWEAVLSGMASGTVEVGSRTPVAGTPAWVTLEVVQGGFATGRYIAEGPLLEDEQRLLTQVAAGQSTSEQPASERMRLNAWYLSDPGLDQLAEALRSGRYEVEVPEHGALLVVAWMVEHGHDGLALDLVAELYPLLDRLRFYPTVNNRPPASGAMVRRETVGEVIAKLSTTRVPTQVAAMNETLTVWHPLYDRLVALWSETVADDWPCSTWPSDWAHQRRRWLDVYETAAASHTLSEEHVRPRSNFAILRTALERCESDSSALTGRDVGRIRAALKGSIARWGEPGSSRREQLREQQSEWASHPTRQQLARVLVSRLARLPPDGGIAHLEPILDPAAPENPARRCPSRIRSRTRLNEPWRRQSRSSSDVGSSRRVRCSPAFCHRSAPMSHLARSQTRSCESCLRGSTRPSGAVGPCCCSTWSIRCRSRSCRGCEHCKGFGLPPRVAVIRRQTH